MTRFAMAIILTALLGCHIPSDGGAEEPRNEVEVPLIGRTEVESEADFAEIQLAYGNGSYSIHAECRSEDELQTSVLLTLKGKGVKLQPIAALTSLTSSCEEIVSVIGDLDGNGAPDIGVSNGPLGAESTMQVVLSFPESGVLRDAGNLPLNGDLLKPGKFVSQESFGGGSFVSFFSLKDGVFVNDLSYETLLDGVICVKSGSNRVVGREDCVQGATIMQGSPDSPLCILHSEAGEQVSRYQECQKSLRLRGEGFVD